MFMPMRWVSAVGRYANVKSGLRSMVYSRRKCSQNLSIMPWRLQVIAAMNGCMVGVLCPLKALARCFSKYVCIFL